MDRQEIFHSRELHHPANGSWSARTHDRQRATFAGERRSRAEQDGQPAAVDKRHVAQVEDERARACADRLVEGALELWACGDVNLAAQRQARRLAIEGVEDLDLSWKVVGHRTLSSES